MLSRYLKKTLVFSVVAAGIFMFVLSCDSPLNPFSPNLGAKVDIEPPTVTVASPMVGAFLKGPVQFSGTATAYRDLKNVEVRILNSQETNPPLPPIMDWTPITISGEARFKQWTFDLDTTDFPDDFLRLQFRANDTSSDWKGRNESVISVFIVKNGPSIIKTTQPPSDALARWEADPTAIPQIGTGTEIIGTVTDRRGVKPGYPMIKFWPDKMPDMVTPRPEPADDDPDWGWAVLPLSGLDDYVTGVYTDRSDMRVINSGNFSFRLAEYTIDPVTRRLVYTDGFPQLPAGQDYRFRIKTFEQFFDERATIKDENGNDVKNPGYMKPVDPPAGDTAWEANYPESGPAYLVKLVSTGTRPEIGIDNTDKPRDNNGKVDILNPHIYIDDQLSNKILVDSKYRNNTWKPTWSTDGIFRLRIKATHDEVIQRAILEWSHTANGVHRSGFLEWDDTYENGDTGLGYVNDTAGVDPDPLNVTGATYKAFHGHKGLVVPDGKVFEFTARGSHVFNGAGSTWSQTANAATPFYGSNQPYTLTVRVPYASGEVKQTYQVYLDGSGPTVKVSSVRGASDVTSPGAADHYYTVNGNIQVALDITAKEIVAKKWIIEDVTPSDTDPNSTQYKLEHFRANPTIATNLEFFSVDIPNTESTANSNSARIRDPNEQGEFAEDRAHNFKVNVGKWQTPPTLKTLWVYAIVQDEAYNLGYKVQKLVVDGDKDKPTLKVEDLLDDTEGVANIGVLYVADSANQKNVKDSTFNIELSFSDDDAIRPVRQTVNIPSIPTPTLRNGGISITLTAHNYNPARGGTVINTSATTTTIAGLSPPAGNNNFTQQNFNVFLTQAVMANALSMGSVLLDGLYTITITINDDQYSKVYFEVANLPPSVSVTKVIHFAIRSRNPEFTTITTPIQSNSLEYPANKSMQTNTPIDLYGRVTSRLRIQDLKIAFAPDVIKATPGTDLNAPTNPPVAVNLYSTAPTVNAAGKVTTLGTAIAAGDLLSLPPNTNGDYVYYWVYQNVNFDPYNHNLPTDPVTYPERRFKLIALDGVAGEEGQLDWEVQVDTKPPEVALVQFNFGRLYHDGESTVNGKVPIEISVTDANGIKMNGSNPAINWFVLPVGTPLNTVTWDDTTGHDGESAIGHKSGRAGTLTAANNVSGGNYRFYLNTGNRNNPVNTTSATRLADGNYALYVVAWDTANNRNTPTALWTFNVKQDSDLPYLRDTLSPRNNGFIGMDHRFEIKGRVFDDDGFNATPNNTPTRNYVQIRFRNTDGSIYTGTWTDNSATPAKTYNAVTATNEDDRGWMTIDALRLEEGSNKGDIEFLFNFLDSTRTDNPSTAIDERRHPYFADGIKEYQIRIVDEATAAAADATGKRDPWGKNPDTLESRPAAAPNPAINAVTVYYPGADPSDSANANALPLVGSPSIVLPDNTRITYWYKFTIKANPPKIIFKTIAESDRIYNTISGANGLLTALNGGKVEDDSLRDASFSYGGVTTPLPLNAYGATTTPGLRPDTQTNVKSWTWTLNGTWLGTDGSPGTGPFYTLPDGPHSVTVRATDTLLKSGSDSWTFTKDTTGPTISLDNISQLTLMTVSGDAGTAAMSVRGSFNDLYSNLGTVTVGGVTAEGFQYKLYRADAAEPANWSTQLITLNGGGIIPVEPADATNKKGATWTVLIPGTFDGTTPAADGPYKFKIRVTDKLGNSNSKVGAVDTETTAIDFIVDRRNPEMLVLADNFHFANNAGNTGSRFLLDKNGVAVEDGIMAESDRVFGIRAAGASDPATDKYFTLSGVVYEHNLDTLRVNFRNGTTAVAGLRKEVTGINAHAIAWKNGGNVTASASNTANVIRVRRATAGDMTAFFPTNTPPPDYRYVWELDVTKGDFDGLKTDDSDDAASRSVSVIAYDTARKDSGAQNWLFKLDSTGPVISFTNLDSNAIAAPAGTALEEQTIILQGSVEDEGQNNIQVIQYKIEKYTHSSGTWGDSNPATKWTITTGTSNGGDANGFKNYALTPAKMINWRITPTDTDIPGDGYYRVTIKAADGTLKGDNAAGNAGNISTSPVVYFYVDRAGPTINWGTVNDYYKWDAADKITLTVTAEDVNTILWPARAVNGVTYGTLTNSATKANTGALVTYTITGGQDTGSATLTVTIDRNGQTIESGKKYTLTLYVHDKAGIQALSSHTTSFTLDTTAPTMHLDTIVNDNVISANEAITGRVIFRGRFTKPAGTSPVKRVAYKISMDTNVTPPANLDEASLLAADWYFNYDFLDTPPSPLTTTNNNPYKLWINAANNALTPVAPAAPTGKGLVEIDQGDKVADLKVYDTRRLVTFKTANSASTVLGNSEQVGNKGLTFGKDSDNAPIPLGTTEDVYQLKIWLLAIDEAGNAKAESFYRWVYPKGDIPIVTEITSPDEKQTDVNRRLNGSITIAGKAVDNYRIGRVWFRVLDTVSGDPIKLTVPEWDEFWNARSGTEQPHTTAMTGQTGANWYMANGGGSREVSWWAQINTAGELDPTTGNEKKITIQVIAEDMIFDDDTGENTVNYSTTAPIGWRSTTTNWYSALKTVNATVVSGAPVFINEQVKSSASNVPGATTGWSSLLTTNVRARASYQVTVRHPTGVGAVRWTNAPYNSGTNAVTSTTNLLDLPGAYMALYNSTYLPRVNANNGGANAIAVKAEPKSPTRTMTQGKKYMVWVWDGELTNFSGLPQALPAGETVSTANQRYVIFTAASDREIPDGIVLEETTDGNYEWLITIDLNTAANGLNLTQAYHPVNLEATDNSKPVAIVSRKVASIPVDNVAPTGHYTHSTNIAGTAPTFGGDANDGANRPNGLDRVVMWFSRSIDGTPTSIVWDRESNPALTASQGSTMANPPAGVAAATGVTWPTNIRIPNMTYTATDKLRVSTDPVEYQNNNYYIVIDRQDPLGNQEHHGHKQAMGWAAGAEGTYWYVSLDSTKMESGRVTAHYIVYDKAGNGTYYSQQLMILNKVPKITKITLATNILGDTGTATGNKNLNTGPATATGGLGTGTGNLTFTDTDTYGGVLKRIRDKMGTNASAAAGISEEITVDTSKPGVHSLVIDQKDFMVRNGLLAVKVETTEGLATGKNRSYRVEYVSRTRELTGFGTTGNTLNAAATTTAPGGIRAGKVYIINNAGNDFPWGVFGAGKLNPGESYQRGTAFLAMVDGAQVNLGTTTGFGNPSVWELNGGTGTNGYYRGTGITATNYLERPNVPTNLALADVTYAAGGSGGRSADFVYRSGAFSTDTTNVNYIVDFSAGGTTGANLYTVADFVANNRNIPGTPKPYPASASEAPNVAHSLFIVKIFDGPEVDLFGDFALLSVRVNNNDKTPPYAQLYDLNPKTEEANNLAEALKPQIIGGNRAMGGLYQSGTPSITDPGRSGHIEPRKTTSLTSSEMGGAATAARGTVTRPYANSAAFFETDTVSGDIIVRGYAEDNQRIARVDLEFVSAANALIPTTTSSTTILTQATKNNNNPLIATSAIAARVQFTETFDLNRHRVEWAYRWTSDDLPGGTNVVGNISVRVRAYNAHNSGTGTASPVNPAVTANNTHITANERVHTSPLVTHPGPETAALGRFAYDSFNPGYPVTGTYASGNNNTQIYLRYNQIRVNLRPYITSFLRNQGQGDQGLNHNIRSRQGRFIVRREETPAITGFNLGGTGTTDIYLPTGNAIVLNAIDTTDNTQRNNYVVNATHRNTPVTDRVFTTRYRVFNAAIPTTAVTGTGKIELTVNGYSAVNTPRTGTTDADSIRPLSSSQPVVQPWNKEYTNVEGSEMWDDYTMLHIWRSDENTTAAFDRGRFARGNFNITYPSMSIDPNTGTLWESHQEGGRKPSGTHNSLYPGGGAYISNNNDPDSMPYNNAPGSGLDTAGLRQIAAFSEHMTYTNVFVDNDAKVWAANSSITKYGESDRWRFLPGMWLWGPIANDANNAYNGSPLVSHYPRTTSTADPTGQHIRTYTQPDAPAQPVALTTPAFDNGDRYHWFEFPTNTGMYAIESLWYNGATNSRSVAAPQSVEQFHSPHVVAYTPASGDQYVHVSYFDSKDGSLKYRYNKVGTTGIVHTEASPRDWVNLDGGADIDDNSDSGTAPGNTGPGAITPNYRGYYSREPAVNPNSGQTAPQNEASNSAYAGGTSYTLTQRSGTTGTLTRVWVQNGSYVYSGQTIYTINDVNITAPSAGFIVLNYRSMREAFTAVVSATVTNDVQNNTRRLNFADNGLNEGDTVTIDGVDRYVLWVNGNYFKVSNNYTMANPGSNVYNIPVGNYVVNPRNVVNASDPIFRIYPLNETAGTSRIVNPTNRFDSLGKSKVVAGKHNAITVIGGTDTIAGYPVVAYYDETNQGLKLAVSKSKTPTLASDWNIVPTDDIFTGTDSIYASGTGAYVSIQMNGTTLHIAAMNALTNNVVYIRGTINPTTAPYFTKSVVQVVDSVGNVGGWCKLSLDSNGNPWIAYMDQNNRGSKDGAKVAYYMGDTARDASYKYTGANYQTGDTDLYGKSIAGWEFMHVPTRWRVENAELGMERYPTIRKAGTRPLNGSAGLPSFAAVGFLGEDYYRIAYYIE